MMLERQKIFHFLREMQSKVTTDCDNCETEYKPSLSAGLSNRRSRNCALAYKDWLAYETY